MSMQKGWCTQKPARMCLLNDVCAYVQMSICNNVRDDACFVLSCLDLSRDTRCFVPCLAMAYADLEPHYVSKVCLGLIIQ